MINGENKKILIAYAVTIALVAVLVYVIMNLNAWFFTGDAKPETQFTAASRGLVNQNDLRFGLFNDAKFRSLGPLLTDAERKQLEAIENAPAGGDEPGTITGTATGTVKPTTGRKPEVRRSNPFKPF